MTEASVGLDAQVKCVERELALRRRVYPNFIARGKLTPAKADAEIAAMEAVLSTLRALADVGAMAAVLTNLREQAVAARARAQSDGKSDSL